MHGAAARLTLLLTLCTASCWVGEARPVSVGQYLHGVQSALWAGDLALAERLLAAARCRGVISAGRARCPGSLSEGLARNFVREKS